MTDSEVIDMIKRRMREQKIFSKDLQMYLNRSPQMISHLLSGRRKWQPSDMTALRGILEKFSVVA